MTKSELAEQYFRSGYNCAQAVIAAFSEDFGVDVKAALKISEGFGGGIGRMRSVCGAASGMFMAIGLAKSNAEGYRNARRYLRGGAKGGGRI